MSFLKKWYGGQNSSIKNQPIRNVTVEPIETRQLLSVAPAHVTAAYLDNRGTASIKFSQNLNPATLTAKSAGLYSAGSDGKIGTADDKLLKTNVKYTKGILTLSVSLKKNQPYRVVLDSKVIRDINGKALDGEFKGQGIASGNGKAGGNFDVATRKAQKVVYRFAVTTSPGVTSYINVNMFTDTPITLANFKQYADVGAWDKTFFHRSTRDSTSGIQVIQGGGFNTTAQGDIGSVGQHTGVGLELKHSNVAYTIAMARTSDTNSNTNQWFFNVNDNIQLDSFGGGYTVFGTVTDKASQKVIASINSLTIRKGDPTNSNSPFNELPSLDATGPIDVPKDLVTITRVAMLMDQAAA